MWIAISGSWRVTNAEVESDVRRVVQEIIQKGDGIVTGGALNVDSFALDEALKHDLGARQIRVFLPTTLKIYADHYRKRAREGVITEQQAEDLINQLFELKNINPRALIENMENTEVNKESYFQRNSEVVRNSNELIVFQVNNSAGAQDAVDKAKEMNVPVKIFSYTIDNLKTRET